MTDENRYDDPTAPGEEPVPAPGDGAGPGDARPPGGAPGEGPAPAATEEAGPGSPATPDELTRVEQYVAPGRVRAAWGWTRRAARTTQQALSVHAEGLERLPDGAAILAANHVWAGDFARLGAALDRPLHLATPSANRLLRRRVPVDDPTQGDDAARVLADGGLVVIFPEGAPSPDGDIHRGGTDVAWLALTAKVPVVPIGIVPAAVGPRLLEPLTRRALGPTVIVGEPLDFSRFWRAPALSYALDGVLLRGATDEIMGAIAALTGLAYVDTTPARAAELAVAARRQHAWARARAYPTLSQLRRAEAERREMLRERDEQDLARAVAEAQARARDGR